MKFEKQNLPNVVCEMEFVEMKFAKWNLLNEVWEMKFGKWNLRNEISEKWNLQNEICSKCVEICQMKNFLRMACTNVLILYFLYSCKSCESCKSCIHIVFYKSCSLI